MRTLIKLIVFAAALAAAGVFVYIGSFSVTRGPIAFYALMTVGFFMALFAILGLYDLLGPKELDPSLFPGGHGPSRGIGDHKTSRAKLPRMHPFIRRDHDE